MKRIYHPDGQSSAPAWLVLVACVVASVWIVPSAFVRMLFRGIVWAFIDAGREVRMEVDSLRRIWASRR